MAQELELLRHCPGCEGTGTYTGHGVNPVSVTCVQCGGDGRQTLGYVILDPGLDDVLDKCNDVLDKCNDILDAISE